MMIVGRGTGITVTEVDTVLLLPLASSTVPLTRYVPAILKTCVTAAVPVTAPRLLHAAAVAPVDAEVANGRRRWWRPR